MAGEATRQVQGFQWQGQQQHPVEPAERDIAVDPFSLRQFSRLDMDRPLPIPSVSVADPHASSPARRFGGGGGSASSIAGRMNALAEATGWDDARSASPAQQKETSAGGETVPEDGGFDVVRSSSSSGRKASEPQRWGSDVPLMAAAAAEEEEEDSADYSFPKTRGKNGRGKAGHSGQAPFGCCMYVPGLSSRRAKPPAPARSSSSRAFDRAAALAEKQYQYQYTDEPGTARQSTVSLAVSLERFDCGSLSTSSWGDLELDGKVSSSSCFDLLPLELVLGGEDDETDLPVCSAFVFDRDVIRKSVLKKRLADYNGAGEAPRPSLGRVSSADASGRTSAAHVRVSLKSRAPPAPASP